VSPLSTTIRTANGIELTVRPLAANDQEALASYFLGLSAETRRRYGPHPFDRQTAETLCASIDPSKTIRFLALDPDGRIVGYMILTREVSRGDRDRHRGQLTPGACASLAPSIADAYQDQGIGSQMAQHVLAAAAELGLEQVILMGGVQDSNKRAYHYYEKLGFQWVCSFWTGADETRILNHAMIRPL